MVTGTHVRKFPRPFPQACELPLALKCRHFTIYEQDKWIAVLTQLNVLQPYTTFTAVVDLLSVVFSNRQIVGRSITSPPSRSSVIRKGIIDVVTPCPEVLVSDLFLGTSNQPRPDKMHFSRIFSCLRDRDPIDGTVLERCNVYRLRPTCTSIG